MDEVKKLGTILGIWAHPDDETFGAGGVLAAAVANGQKVVIVTATRGELGIYDESRWPADKLADIRTKESEAAFQELGISTRHYWLDYPDGGCEAVPLEQAVAEIQNIITAEKPDSIITFGPEGLTGHPDHVAVSRWAVVAANDIPVYGIVQDTDQYQQHLKQLDQQFNVYFNIDQPPLKNANECDIVVRLTPDLLNKKLAALRAMPSQYDAMFAGLSAEQLGNMFNLECFVRIK